MLFVIAVSLLGLYCWAQTAMMLPRALFNMWWWLAQAATFILLGFFIIRPLWSGSDESYNSLFSFCSAVVGIVITAMVFA